MRETADSPKNIRQASTNVISSLTQECKKYIHLVLEDASSWFYRGSVAEGTCMIILKQLK